MVISGGVVEGGSLIVVGMDWIGEKRVMGFSEFGSVVLNFWIDLVFCGFRIC